MRTTSVKNRVSYYLRYTLLFLITALVIYAPFLVMKKSFVWEHDSYTQHLKAMVYISRWYRQTLRALLHGNFKAISNYSFAIGYGSDAMTTLAYYGVGDPFYLISALVPSRWIYLFYCLLILVKNYCTGLAFSALCRFRWPKADHDKGCLAGALIYTFCGFSLITCFGQPIFLNALIIFPLVLLGIEKVRDGGKPWLFILSICLATVSNFYFIVSIVLMAVLYALFRYIPFAKGEWKRRLLEIITMFAAGTVGVAMGGVILLPMAQTVLGNSRVSLKPAIHLFYESRTCRQLPESFLSCIELEYGALCYAGTALLCAFLLFSIKGHLKLRLQFILYTALLFIPAFGYLTNGFSYPINRWCWAYSAMIGMLVAELWPALFTLSDHSKRFMTMGLTLYVILCFVLAYTRDFYFLAPFILTCMTLLHLLQSQKARYEESARSVKKFNRAQRSILFLTIAGICVNGIAKNYPDVYELPVDDNNRIESYKDLESLAPLRSGSGASPANNKNFWLNDTSQIASTIGFKSDSFTRVSNTEPGYWYQNSSILNGLSTTQSFWSVNNSNVLEYLEALGVSDVNNNAWQFTNLDGRAILNELASVQYLYCLHPEKLPAGYSDTPMDMSSAKAVYQNQQPLPLGYTYNKTINRAKFDAMTPAQRQEILLSYAVTESTNNLETPGSVEELTARLDCKEIAFTSAPLSQDVVQTDAQTFVVTRGDAQVALSFAPITEGECYLYMKNVQFTPSNDFQIFSDDPQFDPNNLYTSDMLASRTNYQKYVMWREIEANPETKNIKIGAEFRQGQEVVTQNEVNYILPSDEQFYSGRQDFLLNSYTVGKEISSIVVTFPKKGIYHFDTFSVVSEPLAGYENKIAALAAESLENVNIHQDPSSYVSAGVTGEITVSENKLLCLTIPYSKGWRAYVDGSPAALEKVNIMNMGLWLTPGHHTIELRYATPGLLYGACLTAAGILLFILWIILSHRARRRKTVVPVEKPAAATDAEPAEDPATAADPEPAEDPAAAPADAPGAEPAEESAGALGAEPAEESAGAPA